MPVVFESDLLPEERNQFESFYKRYCQGKHDIIMELKIHGAVFHTIAEIGVRAGASALMFCRVFPNSLFVGFDNASYNHGGAGQKAIDWAKAVLSPYIHVINIVDTQTTSDLGVKADFIHVDGDHSKAGCMHDMDLALTACNHGGFILVDDYTHLTEVRAGVDEWLSKHPYLRYEYFPTIRGDILIHVR
jgi:predicted O-methyltransferase YrrM